MSLLWFIAEYTGVRPRVFLWSLTGVQLAMAVVAVSLPFTLYFSGPPQLEHPLMRWGEVITIATLPEGPLLLPTEIVTTPNFVFGLWASGVMWLRGQRRGAVPLFAVLALILSGLWHFPLPGLGDVPTAEIYFVGLVLVMSLVVSNRVVEAAVVKEALAESEQRLRTLVETAPEAVLLLNSASGVALEANDSALELFGEERVSLPQLHPASAAPVEQEDGEPSMLVFQRRMQDAAQGGRPTFRWIVRGRSGGDVSCEARLVRLPGTEPAMTRLSLTDVRELEAAEARQSQLEAQLRRSQRLEALGRLTGGVAHDFNNFLTAIEGNLQLLVEDNPLPPESRVLVAEALRAVDRSVELREGLGTFAADSVQLESALVNLAINAFDAMPEGGRVRLEARNVEVDAAGNGWSEPAPEGRYVGIAVRDEGTGMPPEVLRHAVEPFFTTKPAGKGTGLGLSTVYGFVTQSGGAMHVESAPDEGTCVELLFPAITG